MEIVSGPWDFERKTSQGFEILDFLKVAAAGEGLKARLQRGFIGCVDQHREDRIDQIEKRKSVDLYSVWWFCSSLWLSLTSGKLLNVIFCALFRKECVVLFFFFLFAIADKKKRSQIKSVLVWCDRVNSKRKQMDTVFTRRDKGRRDWHREHSLWARVSGRKSCFRYTEQKALAPAMPPRLAADSAALCHLLQMNVVLAKAPCAQDFEKPR